MFSKLNRSRLLTITGTFGLVVYGFFVAQMIVIFCVQALSEAGILNENSLSSALVQFNAAFIAYALALFIILGLFAAVKNSTKGILDLLAIKKKPKLMSLMYVALGYGCYFLFSFVLNILAQLVIPGFDINQDQQIGFSEISSTIELAMAFLALVVLAPIVEEIIFRGFMYSRIRKVSSFLATSLIVSLTFGLVHMQWNVGVDVFALSMVLCYLREKTDSVWAGVGVHMLKNTLAFGVIFLGFDIEKTLMQLF